MLHGRSKLNRISQVGGRPRGRGVRATRGFQAFAEFGSRFGEKKLNTANRLPHYLVCEIRVGVMFRVLVHRYSLDHPNP